MRLAALFTGGKDSTYAIHLAKKQGHEVTGLIVIKSENPDSYMFHTPAIEITELQAEAMELPIVIGTTKGEKEKELEDLEKTILEAKEKFEFEGVITGALFSGYQKSRIGKICDKLGLKVISLLWHKEQEELMQELIDSDFEFILTAVAAEGLDKSWLNRVITQKDLIELKKLNEKFGFHQAFEGGEAESLVLDCPLFKKKVVIKDFEILEENKNTARLIIKDVRLERK